MAELTAAASKLLLLLLLGCNSDRLRCESRYSLGNQVARLEPSSAIDADVGRDGDADARRKK